MARPVERAGAGRAVGVMSPDEIIDALGLSPHPEGGWFCETFRDAAGMDGRAHSTAIYFLLRVGETSRWHRIDSAEIWHFHAGDPLALTVWDRGSAVTRSLGIDLAAGQRPQAIVAQNQWQSARSTGDWSLVGCTVAPGFDFAHFELAPPGWTPDQSVV